MASNKTAIIILGLPGSGKTTLAQTLSKKIGTKTDVISLDNTKDLQTLVDLKTGKKPVKQNLILEGVVLLQLKVLSSCIDFLINKGFNTITFKVFEGDKTACLANDYLRYQNGQRSQRATNSILTQRIPNLGSLQQVLHSYPQLFYRWESLPVYKSESSTKLKFNEKGGIISQEPILSALDLANRLGGLTLTSGYWKGGGKECTMDSDWKKHWYPVQAESEEDPEWAFSKKLEKANLAWEDGWIWEELVEANVAKVSVQYYAKGYYSTCDTLQWEMDVNKFYDFLVNRGIL
jgi:energy-coupling factor transporter ATP-binding protein EcfA2